MVNCKNILVILTYIYLMMYVFKKSCMSTKAVVTVVSLYLLFLDVEGFMSGFDGMMFTESKNMNQLISPSRKLSALLGTSYVPLRDFKANDQKDTMFFLKDNTCSPSCCPSTYSCDGGCVCTTEQQNQLSSMRFGNNKKP